MASIGPRGSLAGPGGAGAAGASGADGSTADARRFGDPTTAGAIGARATDAAPQAGQVRSPWADCASKSALLRNQPSNSKSHPPPRRLSLILPSPLREK